MKVCHLGKPVVALAILLELLTIFLRFGYQFETTRDTAWMSCYTLGMRIHHGYCGSLLMVLAYGLSQTHARLARVVWILGGSLLLSDLIHHLLVLWPLTGSPQFDVFYP